MKSQTIKWIGVCALAIVSQQAMASSYNDSPMVDVNPDRQAAYEQDLAQCQAVANNNSSGKQSATRRGLRSGAMIGALGGAAVWLPNGMNGHARWLKPIGLHVRVLLLNIQVVCSLANPLKKISLRQTRGDSL